MGVSGFQSAGLRRLVPARDNAAMVDRPPAPPVPYIIVVGNEKGGTGKSTTAMHIVVSLLRHGHRTGVQFKGVKPGDYDANDVTRRVEHRPAAVARLNRRR